MTVRDTVRWACVVAALVVAAGVGVAEDKWWEEAVPAEDEAYRVAHKTELFENEGIRPGDRETPHYDDCRWQCADSKVTKWYVTESVADVLVDGGHVPQPSGPEGGAGSEEYEAARIVVTYWPGVNPTRQASDAPERGDYKNGGSIWVMCKRPESCVDPPLRKKKLWILDVNLEATKGGGPGNNNESSSVNNGDGSGQDRELYDHAADEQTPYDLLIVSWNHDDDDQDDVFDRDDDFVSGDDDLVQLQFQFTDGIIQYKKGIVRILVDGFPPDAEGDHPYLKLHGDSSKQGTIPLEWDGSCYKREYDLENDWSTFYAEIFCYSNGTLYVEGCEKSSGENDAQIKLEYEDAGKKTSDKVKYTVVTIDMTGDLDLDAQIKTDETEDDQKWELTPGAYVALNNDDDNENQTLDNDNAEVQVANENDLKKLELTNITPLLLQGKGKVKLQRTNSKIRVYSAETKGDSPEVLKANNEKEWNLEDDDERAEWEGLCQEGIWVEGYQISGDLKDAGLEVLYTPTDPDAHCVEATPVTPIRLDQIKFTVITADITGDLDLDGDIETAEANNDQKWEQKPGAFVAVNNDDDDANQVLDKNDDEVVQQADPPSSQDEDDLKKFEVSAIKPSALAYKGVMRLSRSNGKVRVYRAATKGGWSEILVDGDDSYDWDLDGEGWSDFDQICQNGLWVEGYETGECTLTLSYLPEDRASDDHPIELDVVEITVITADITGDLDLDGNIVTAETDNDQRWEREPGAFVALNCDDDNENGTIDQSDAEVTGENDLKELEASTIEPSGLSDKGVLRLTRSNGKVRVYRAATKGVWSRILFDGDDSYDWDLDGEGGTDFGQICTNGLWVEGVEAGECTLTLSYLPEDRTSDDHPIVVDDIRVTVLVVDLDVNTDRSANKTITDADEKVEEKWTKGANSRGAIVLPNCDKDNALGAPDNWTKPTGWTNRDWDYDGTEQADEAENAKVDANPDKDDLGPLWLHKLGPGRIPDNLKVILEVSQTAGETYFTAVAAKRRLRIFLPSDDTTEANNLIIKAGDDAIIGPVAGASYEFVKKANPADPDSYEKLKGTGIAKFGVEGIELGSKLDIKLTVKLGANTFATDTVRIRIAPFVLLDHGFAVNTTAAHKTVYVIKKVPDNNDVRAKLTTEYTAARIHEADSTTYIDRWHQDGYEIGYVKAPYGSMPMVLVSPVGEYYGKSMFKYSHRELLKAGVGVCWKLERDSWTDLDSFGNIECKPVAGAPGKFFHGKGIKTSLANFFAAQGVNAEFNANIDTGWLALGHIDEVVSFAPDRQHVLVADPEVCWGLLLYANSIDPDALMLQGMPGAGGVKVSTVVGNGTLRNYNVETIMEKDKKLHKIRYTDLSLTGPVSAPTKTGTSAGELKRGGAFVGFFPDITSRTFKLTFTSGTDYNLQYQDDGGGWSDDGSGSTNDDEVFTEAKCFILKHWWSGNEADEDEYQFVASTTSNAIGLPVLFKERTTAPTGALAYTNNHVNALVDTATVFTAESFGPNVFYTEGEDPQNIIGDYVKEMLKRAGYSGDNDKIITPDERYYHNAQGSIHCGTNVERVLPTYKWWEK